MICLRNRKSSNKFGISLSYSYLCSRKRELDELSRHHIGLGDFPVHRSLPPHRHQVRIPFRREVLARFPRLGDCRLHRFPVCREHLHIGVAWRLQFLVFLVDSGAFPAEKEGGKRLVPQETEERLAVLALENKNKELFCISLAFSYLCSRIIKGCLSKWRAEIKPSSPDSDNTDVGMISGIF